MEQHASGKENQWLKLDLMCGNKVLEKKDVKQ